jgi:exosome complex RNA-binding protein Rrp4
MDGPISPHTERGQSPPKRCPPPVWAQRLRTAQDQRDMRLFLKEGDLISAEVHKVQPSDGSLVLHTRSFRYTKLENGTLIRVPPALIPRRKNYYMTLINGTLDVLWGVNGNIWMQGKLKDQGGEDAKDLAELQDQLRREHAEQPWTLICFCRWHDYVTQ